MNGVEGADYRAVRSDGMQDALHGIFGKAINLGAKGRRGNVYKDNAALTIPLAQPTGLPAADRTFSVVKKLELALTHMINYPP